MWYHWIVLAIAAYMLFVQLKFIFSSQATGTGRITAIVIALVAGAVAWWAYSGAMAPTVPVVMGGRRR